MLFVVDRLELLDEVREVNVREEIDEQQQVVVEVELEMSHWKMNTFEPEVEVVEGMDQFEHDYHLQKNHSSI